MFLWLQRVRFYVTIGRVATGTEMRGFCYEQNFITVAQKSSDGLNSILRQNHGEGAILLKMLLLGLSASL